MCVRNRGRNVSGILKGGLDTCRECLEEIMYTIVDAFVRVTTSKECK